MLDLWDMAKSANFTEKELESFRVRVAPQLRGVAVSLVDVLMTPEGPPPPTPPDRGAQHRLRSPPTAPSPGRRPVWDRASLQHVDTASRPSAEFGAGRV